MVISCFSRVFSFHFSFVLGSGFAYASWLLLFCKCKEGDSESIAEQDQPLSGCLVFGKARALGSCAAAVCQGRGALVRRVGKKQINGAGEEWEAEGTEWTGLSWKVDVTAHHHLTAPKPIKSSLWVWQQKGFWRKKLRTIVTTSGRWLDSNGIIWITKSAFRHLCLQNPDGIWSRVSQRKTAIWSSALAGVQSVSY